MKLSEIKQITEGWTTYKSMLASSGIYQVDITKNFISSSKIELFAVIYTKSHKKVYDEMIYSGLENSVNNEDVENKAKEVLAQYVQHKK